ncbi:MAG: hypothetical protein V4515_12405 [Chloroflexota bacterium]
MHLLRRLRPLYRTEPLADGALVQRMRGHRLESSIRLGPNEWHVAIIHADGTVDDLGISRNLLTTVGRDLLAAGFGNPAGKDGALTASSATSATPAGGGMTVDAYKGWRVYAPVTGLTTAPVYGNIGSNSATVLTIDQWWTAADGVGATPAATNGYHIQPATIARFMALTENAGAASAADTVLTGEITTGGLARAIATYAHTPGAATYTMTKSFSVTASFPAIHKGALFTAANPTAAGVMVFEAVLNADAIVVNGDTLQIVATNTLSG